MNCNDIDNLLATGAPLDKSASEHVAGCPDCRPLCALLEAPAASLSPEEVARLRRVATHDLRPVRPLPRDATLVCLLLLSLAGFCVGAASFLKMYAVHIVSPIKMGVFLGVLAACAAAAVVVSIQEMIPGSKRRLQPGSVAIGVGAALVATAFVLFPNFDAKGFLRWGPGCLRAGSICAGIVGTALVISTAKYCFGSVLRTALTVGVVSGLAGITVLTLHCPLWTIPHVVVWHFGVLVVGIGIGAALGFALRAIKGKLSSTTFEPRKA